MNSPEPSPHQPGADGSLRAYVKENGLFLLSHRIAGAALRRTRDRLLARRLGTQRLRIGRHPRLAGLAHIHLGENFSAGDGLWLDAITFFAGNAYAPSLTIGPNCNVSDHVHIACTNRITIAEGLLCGSRVIISDHAHGRYSGTRQSPPSQRPLHRPLSHDGTVTIGRNVWIGDGAAILAGADIGDGAIIGANSLVNGPVPPHTIAAGTPVHPLRHWTETTQQWLRLATSDG